MEDNVVVDDKYINAYLTIKRSKKSVSNIIDNGIDNFPDNVQEALIKTENELTNIVNEIQDDMHALIGGNNG